tara:strand:+ start:777 stop:878 length:102 start_codon:yes stop_codon:yes gene_type:complete
MSEKRIEKIKENAELGILVSIFLLSIMGVSPSV